MAENSEEVIFKIRIDYSESENDLKKLTSTINDLKKSNEDNTEAIKRAEKAAKANQDATKAEEGSIRALRESNKALTAERNNLSTATVEGRKRILELNQQLDQNNKTIKENVDAYTKQKIGIGDYTSGIVNAIPSLKGFTGGITGLNTAFKANPIGLVVTALVALKGIFSQNAAFADKLTFAFDGLSKGFQFIVDTIYSTVTSFDKLKEAITSPLQFIKSFASGTAEAAKAGYEASVSIDAFAAAQAKANQAIEIADIKIQSLEKSLKDRTKSEKERIAIANELADLEIANAKRREELAKQEEENAKLRLKDKTLSGEEEAELIKLQTAVLVEAERTRVTEAQRTTRINILLAKEEAAEKKEVHRQSIVDFEDLEKRRLESILENQSVRLEINQEETDQYLANAEAEMAAEDAKILKDSEYTLKQQQNSEARAIARDREQKAEVAGVANALGQISSITKKNTLANKALSAVQATINTWLGVTEIISQKSTLPSPFDFIAKAINVTATIGSGLAAIGNINKAAGGGNFLTKGPTMLLVGDNPGGVERVTVEPLSGRGKTVVNPNSNLVAMAGGGTLTSVGSNFQTNSVATSIESERNLNNSLAMAIKNMQPVLVLQDFERVQNTRNEINTTAQVL